MSALTLGDLPTTEDDDFKGSNDDIFIFRCRLQLLIDGYQRDSQKDMQIQPHANTSKIVTKST